MFPLWLIVAFPLFGFAANGLVSVLSARNAKGPSVGLSGFVAVTACALSFITVIVAMGHMGPTSSLFWRGWDWLPLPHGWLSFDFAFDRLTAVMLLFITGIGTLIHIYSIGYMGKDRGFARFMAYLNLFMASMIVLVLGASLPVTFLGWEGVGLCSYLLIGFWKEETANCDAARKAFVISRIGDLGFLLGAFALYTAMGDQASLNYAQIAQFFGGEPGLALAGSGLLCAAAALLFFGCTGKSAQLPLLTWLPDAMAGPTPVSALIHAATMVTSGVYLCARLCDVYVLSGWVMPTIALIGCATALYGAIAGMVQWNIKKVMAYSTISQNGFMFMAIGVGAFDVAIFHVVTHAFFKATLFLGAGSVITALHHEQDMRRMGGLAKALPITYSAMWFGWFAIIGLPMGSGFMSKDLIIERLFHGSVEVAGVDVGIIIFLLALLAALLTAVYMSRMMYLTFWSPSRVPAETKAHLKEQPLIMSGPLLLLGFGAMAAGCVWFDLVPNLNLLGTYLAPVLGQAQSVLHAPVGVVGAHGSAAPIILAVFSSVILAPVGILIARLFYRRGPRDPEVKPLQGFAKTWIHGLDAVYDAVIVAPVRGIAWILARVVDQVVIGGVVRSVGSVAGFLGEGYAAIQRGRLRVSVLMSLAGAMILIIYLMAPLFAPMLGKGA